MPSSGISCIRSGPVWTGDPPTHLPTTAVPPSPPTHAPLPNFLEQMGADPISKLAAAIDRLADAIQKHAEN